MTAANAYLQLWDYVIIVVGLTVSSAYGLYHGVRSRKTTSKGTTTFEYLLASRSMDVVPIAFSYFASFTSTGTFIGFPTEVYTFGAQISLFGCLIVPCIFIINEIFLPIYYRLKSGSLYEYLELRFNATIKNIVTAMAFFQTIVLSSANLYGTATALSQVTALNMWFIVVILAALCILYTTFGGIRAVILADVVQAMFMLIALVLLLTLGIYYVGDIGLIYRRNLDTDRLDFFQLDFNLNARLTFWNTTVAYIFTYLSLTVTSQFLMQRLMTAQNIAAAKRANILGTFLFLVSMILTHSIGLVIYATFHGCDPLQSGLIGNANQLVPAYLMKVLSSYVTLPGILFTGILCATLSTLSSVYNSTATILFNMFPQMSDKRATLLCKTLVLIVGVLSILGVAVAEMFPNVLQSLLSVFAVIGAPLFGMLLIGLFCPQANIKVTCVSFMCSVCFLLYIIAGSLLVKPLLVTKYLSTESCDSLINNTAWNSFINDTGSSVTSTVQELGNLSLNSTDTNFVESSSSPWSAYFPLSSMSYLWYSAVGTLSTLLIFSVLSVFVGKENAKPVNLEIIPEVVQQMHRKLPQRVRRILFCDVYEHQVLKALNVNEITSEQL